MNRLGLRPAEVPALLTHLRMLDGLMVEGIFTHFATSDELDKRHAEAQFAEFSALLAELATAGLRPPIAHAANSAALLTMPQTHLDMVRSGIALYGLDPDMNECRLPAGFQPALTWKAIVTQVATLAPGAAVSYGREFIAAQPTRMAVIPVGYADGFPAPTHLGQRSRPRPGRANPGSRLHGPDRHRCDRDRGGHRADSTGRGRCVDRAPGRCAPVGRGSEQRG